MNGNYRQKHLLESSNSPLIPKSVVVLSVGITTNDVLGENHNESLLSDSMRLRNRKITLLTFILEI